MAGTFQTYTDKTGEHRFRLRAPGQGTVLAGEPHPTRESLLAAIENVRVHAQRGKAYERKDKVGAQHAFILKGAEGETLGIGGGFASFAERDRAIQWIMSHAATAAVAESEAEG